MTIAIRAAECHPDVCLDVEGLGGHTANVNPIGYSDDKWRVDCDHCATCIRAGFDTKREAVDCAKEHVLLSSEAYWIERDKANH